MKRRMREETEKEKRLMRARMEVESEFRKKIIIKYVLVRQLFCCCDMLVGSVVVLC